MQRWGRRLRINPREVPRLARIPRPSGFGAIFALVAARAARRRSAAALVALSVAGSIVVLGSLLGVGVITVDRATQRAMADLPPAERVIGIHRSSEDSAGDAEA